ncbi:hypothetical protein BM1_02969 [Bipolaris maydis]|nr:hypothetical protein BM1_02969 [Bipolaris maydis]KAJ5020535.1 hypothetical protein J3E73DRAFT_386647 [Bipolaris maydis]KAJ5030689.1 hypothetical protein J3E73DRAFT_378679 [Bipolaris maydis]KAJ6274476.1 hypothetical protein PSV08DRAFT_358834 [Bipolaris maydis]KAJ6286243.1 hypothetical protein J3E71DRAFT_349982 [Bipolaris maydis]
MSSPSLPMQQVQSKSNLLPRQEETCRYRQTIYHDKAGVQIAESRRRAAGARKVDLPTQTYTDFVLYPTDSIEPSSRSHSYDSSRCSASKFRERESYSTPHVTSAKHSSKARQKPAIIQRALEPRRILSGDEKRQIYLPEESTPPPTPRSTRLSTPELPDLKEVPFCDCGVGGHIVKYCKTCNKEVDRWPL